MKIRAKIICPLLLSPAICYNLAISQPCKYVIPGNTGITYLQDASIVRTHVQWHSFTVRTHVQWHSGVILLLRVAVPANDQVNFVHFVYLFIFKFYNWNSQTYAFVIILRKVRFARENVCGIAGTVYPVYPRNLISMLCTGNSYCCTLSRQCVQSIGHGECRGCHDHITEFS